MKGQNFTQRLAKRHRPSYKGRSPLPDHIRVEGISITCGTCNKRIVTKQETITGAQAAAIRKGAVVLPFYEDVDGVVFHHRDCVRKEQTRLVRREDVPYYIRKPK